LADRCRNGTAKRLPVAYIINHVQPSHEGLVMKKTSIAGALITSAMLVAGSAMAADMKAPAPVYTKAPMAPPAFSWTGCYLGGGGGYGMWNQETFHETDPGHVATSPTQTGGGRGWFGTVQVGCDYQIASSFVIGAQGDWDFGNLKGTPNFSLDNIGDEKNSWTWAAGGRIGYVAFPQLLAYVSGGYTQAHFDQVNFLFDETGAASNLFILANTYHGWYIGSGYEYGLSFLPGLFWKTEYRYSSFDAADLSHLSTTTGLTNGTASNSKKFIQTIRSELVWRINWFH
jgi:opacity protein-like surface antigen